MSEAAHAHHPNYIRVWAILCVLLVVSALGPLLEIRVVTLVTAFGIAIVKAYMVCVNFMHLNVEKRYVVYLLSTCLVFMLLFFTASAPDVMKFEGTNWEKPIVRTPPPAEHHEGGHGGAHEAAGGAHAGH
jgi:caa(3)-type oxidase subunit IV